MPQLSVALGWRQVGLASLLAVWFVLPVGWSQEPATLSLPYQVGVASVDVTPAYPVRLNGFGGRREEAAGTSQRLWAKALAISHGTDSPVVIVTLDNLGVRESLVDQVAAELAKRFKLPRENLVVTFTHTHCAPKVNGASDTIFSSPIPPEHQEHIDRYTSELPGLIVAAAAEAIDSRRPASLAWGVGKVGFAVNRRTAGGPVDHDLPLLVAADKTGKPFAIYTTYACHCVTLSFNQYSGDWAGYAQELIEREFPRVTALVSIGCGSDANPSSGVTGDNVAAAAAQGGEIAAEVKRLLAGALRPLSGPLAAKLEHLSLPLNPLPSRADLETQAATGGATGYNASWQLGKLDRGEQLTSELRYPIQSLRFGEQLQMIFLAGEVCVDYSLRLKRELNRDRVWLHGYSNDFGAYIPSERLLKEGGYGGGAEISYFALPTTLAAGLEDRIVAAVKQQSPEAFQAIPGTQGVPPKSPEESLASLRVAGEFRVELVASEPLVEDPVAIDFGPDGRIWVAEMPDYGRGVQEDFQGEGRVKFLVDTDRDGKSDKATLFLEGLRFPTDVKVWRDGVLICDAPDILFAADRDGDGRAEIREVLLTGFATHNPHARVNSLRWGLDGFLYGSGGLFGGKLRRPNADWTTEVDTGSRDFRLDAVSLAVEPATGQTQQGRTRDDFGNWFGCNNSVLLMHYPVAQRFTERNDRLRPPALSQNVASPEHGQQLFPAENLVLFQLSGAPGRPTSACGAEIFRSHRLGDSVYGDAFICEPVNQLVHRMKLKRNGHSFLGERAESEGQTEFLVSTDNWFRPVQARTGPDGALYLVDMYRYVIEHGQWIPEESKAELDLFAGQRLGRLYRVIPREGQRIDLPDWSRTSELELVAELGSDNGARRDLAYQVLFWREHLELESWQAIVRLMQTSEDPAVRLQAFAAARHLGPRVGQRLDVSQILSLLDPGQPELCAAVLRLIAESSEEWDFSGKLGEAIAQLVQHVEDCVRLEAVYLLSFLDNKAGAKGLIDSLQTGSDDSVLTFAIMGSITKSNAAEVWAGATRYIKLPEQAEVLGQLLEVILGKAGAEVAPLAVEFVEGEFNAGESASLEDGLTRRLAMCRLAVPILNAGSAVDPLQWAKLISLCLDSLDAASESSDELPHGAWRDGMTLADLFSRSTLAERLNAEQRQRVMRFVLSGLLPQRAPEVQLAALQALASDGAGWMRALEQWSGMTPPLRRELLESGIRRRELTRLLLSALEAGTIRANELDAGQRSRLLSDDREEIRREAERILQQVVVTDRARITEEWQEAIALGGDFERGRIVFRQHCAACHRLDGIGHEIGPDLAALTNRMPSALLVATLDPNRDVESRYLAYSALTRDGVTLSGLLAGETVSSITLREREGKEHVLLRSELEELVATQKSVMPEGLEQDLTRQGLADLFAYLGPPRTPRRVFDGNQPVTLHPDPEGIIDCSAATAEIFGEAIVFESGSPYRNLGYWQADRDHAVWTIELGRAGAYDVYLDYACNPDTAGNGFVIAGPAGELVGTVDSTGAWSEYRWKKVGELQLSEGRQQLTVGFSGPRRGPALMDLRSLVLVPAGRDWPAK